LIHHPGTNLVQRAGTDNASQQGVDNSFCAVQRLLLAKSEVP